MKDITFDEFLEYCRKEIAVMTSDVWEKDTPKIKVITINPNEEGKRIKDKIDFFERASYLIMRFPKCEKLIIDGVHRYEQTGVKFQVCYNCLEYPDDEIPNDLMPIVLYFPGLD